MSFSFYSPFLIILYEKSIYYFGKCASFAESYMKGLVVAPAVYGETTSCGCSYNV